METIYGAKIPTSGEVEFLTDPVVYKTMSDAVGGYIEPVGCPNGDVLYVNEEGLLCGLDRNVGAMLVGQHPHLVGDAIVVGPLDDEGEHLPLTAALVKFLKS